MSKKRKRGGNLDALEAASRRARASALPDSTKPLRRRSRATNAALTHHPRTYELPPARKPLELPTANPRKAPLRAATKAALVVKGKGEMSRAKRGKLDTARALRDAICADYQRDRSTRRETMFANGSAGKGRRNPGNRKRDWRAEYCK